jgi:hypothetical protein
VRTNRLTDLHFQPFHKKTESTTTKKFITPNFREQKILKKEIKRRNLESKRKREGKVGRGMKVKEKDYEWSEVKK